MNKEGYRNSLEHIVDEMKRIDLLIRLMFHRVNQQFSKTSEYHGMFISEQEIDILLGKTLRMASVPDDHAKETLSHIETLKNHSEHMKAVSREKDIGLSLDRLSRQFHLNAWDTDILLLCLAPELDVSYEKIYAYIQDDLTRKKPGVDFVLNVICRSFEEKMSIRRRLEPGSPLIDFGIIQVLPDQAGQVSTLLGSSLKVDERIVSYLLEEQGLDPHLSGIVRLVYPNKNMDDLVLNETVRDELARMFRVIRDRDRGLVIYFYGPYGTGKKSTVEAWCTMLTIPVLYVDIERMMENSPQDYRTLLSRVMREAVLQNACVYWQHGDRLLEDSKKSLLHDFAHEVGKLNGLCIIEGLNAWEPVDLFQDKYFFSQGFTLPSHDERLEIWRRLLDQTDLAEPVDRDILSSTFTFSGGQIKDALNSARNLSLKHPDDQGKMRVEDVYAACRLQSNQKLSSLARKLKPVYTWADIVLPEDRMEQLISITHHVRYRSLVFGTWGFDRKLSYGKGLHVLFSGPSGTGKTMAAEIMAGDLGLDIYKIDLARVVSKYIGETEKNLSKIFEEAETSHAILFFDEADAIFGKRSDIHDAHDRYANIETSYLLQRMEEYEGMTILSTNFRRNMDEAFVRRIQFAVEFPFPDAQNRKHIWTKIWPKEMPVSQDIDFDFLARRFEMSGGNIRNISLHAAFIAAADGRVVTMPHLKKATQREYQKMGKLLMGHEFSDHQRTELI